MEIKIDAYKKELETIIDTVLNTKGLSKSKLKKNRKVNIKGDKIDIQLNGYLKFIEKGRRPGVKKIPINVLIQYIKSRGIRTNNINSLAFAIQRSIFKKGIRAKGDIIKIINEQSVKLVKEKTTKQLTDFIKKEIKNI